VQIARKEKEVVSWLWCLGESIARGRRKWYLNIPYLAESESASLATLPDLTSVVNTPTGQNFLPFSFASSLFFVSLARNLFL
jgi:hypothetical protein